MRLKFVFRRCCAAVALGLLSACVTQHTAPHSLQPGEPLAVAARLELEPLDLSPDGEARLLVRLHYSDKNGTRAHVPPGGHVDVSASRGSVQWQPRARYGDPAAIVRLTEAGPLTLTISSDLPHLPHQMRALTDTRAWRLPPVIARALGPHTVVVGWFPRLHAGVVQVARGGTDGVFHRLASVRAPASSFRDTAVQPGAHYTYEIGRPSADRIDVGVDMPRQLPQSSIDVMRGKAMWLSFDDVAGWNVDAMLDRARTAGLRAIELRLTYGEYAEITAARRPVVDAFIDGAARRGIAIIGWTVPRAVSFEDLAANVAAAAYTTPGGHGISGLAVDLERGPDFLPEPTSVTRGISAGAGAGAALAQYVARLREAVGPRVLLVATVEDPYLEHLTDAEVPYAGIAAQVDVLQPMVYWRARRAGASISGMETFLNHSYETLQRLAGRAIPIDIGGQTVNLGNHYGAPPAAEVGASVGVARGLRAIGETFFDWDGTSAGQWAAIAGADWPAAKRTDDREPGMPKPAPAGSAGGSE